MTIIQIGDPVESTPRPSIDELIADLVARAKTGQVKIRKIHVEWWETKTERTVDSETVSRYMQHAAWHGE